MEELFRLRKYLLKNPLVIISYDQNKILEKLNVNTLKGYLKKQINFKKGGYVSYYGRIIDGTEKEPISDGVVVINDNKIEQLGSKKNVHIPQDARL